MKIVFMGTPDFAVPAVDALKKAGHDIVLCVTQPDKAAGRGNKVKYSEVKEWAIENDVPVFQPVRIKNEESVEELKKYPADVFVVAAFGQILPEDVLKMPRLGCVNIHASLLPKYRGASPIQWAVLNGDKTSGVTIMQMGVGLDDGDILLQEEVELDKNETGGSLFDRLSEVGAKLIVEALPKLDSGEITPIPQDESKATKVGMIRKALGKISFMEPAEKIERYVRGLYPWPGAYTFLDGKTVKIHSADVTDLPEDAPKDLSNGTVVYSDKDTLIIKTSDKCLSVKELQLEGKKRMSISDFLRGHKIETGAKFG
ncbi:MAG: methionyl-tRNA formyltransferase [Lachnospiraceae bacterium]|nr:methionyl-tRNA formyltransferase [Lachnospiraceae bacterium]